jgi:hypothetical protein
MIFFSLSSYAQPRFSYQGSAVFPTGYLEDAVEVGFGNTINASVNVFYSNLEVTASIGYYFCGFKEDLPDYNFSLKTIPILVGGRINLTDHDFIPYLGIQAGIYLNEYNLEIDDKIFGLYTAKTKENHLGAAVELGFRMNLSPSFDIDVNAKYNLLKNKYIARSFVLIQAGFAIRV